MLPTVSACLLCLVLAVPCFANGNDRRPADLVARAARLAGLPDDVAVRLVDPDLTGDPAQVSRLDAFVVREADGTLRRVVYVNLHAPVMRRVLEDPARFLPLLAAVLHHEHQHLEGADEAQALAAERRFLRGLGIAP